MVVFDRYGTVLYLACLFVFSFSPVDSKYQHQYLCVDFLTWFAMLAPHPLLVAESNMALGDSFAFYAYTLSEPKQDPTKAF